MSNRNPSLRNGVQLFALSFAALFLELMLIRWVPAVVLLVAYYANLMLISSFLGLGIGAMLAGRKRNWFVAFPFLVAIDIAILWSCSGERPLALASADAKFFHVVTGSQLINGMILVGVFLMNVLVFIPLGQRIGQLFRQLPALRAYTWDLCGSLCGTLCFGTFSLMHFSPIIGFSIVSMIYVALSGGAMRYISGLVLAIAVGMTFFTTSATAVWSPYYYITMAKMGDLGGSVSDPVPNLRSMLNPPMYVVRVGRNFYQIHGTLDPARYTPGTIEELNATHKLPQYTVPYQIETGRARAAIFGAGGGMDVEAALLSGMKHVDAIEIDPMLVQISHRFNAADVYNDPRVTVHIDDARAAMRKLTPGYDLIAFGFLDSQALFSTMSNLRLDGFIYTVQSMRNAFDLLAPDGVLSLSFACPKEWLPRKLMGMLKEATGIEPISYYFDYGVVLIVPKGKHAPIPESYKQWQRVDFPKIQIAEPTDNWPYLYLERKTIPLDYALVISALVVFSILTIGFVRGWSVSGNDAHFFFMGMGFLLLQTKSVTDCSLFFGTTWLVTTIVIAGILLMVLAANITAIRLRAMSRWFYLPLFMSLLLLYFVPRDLILSQDFAVRLAWSLLIVPLPIFFAGLIFSTTFREARDPSLAFGANLIGATIGGFCEYLGMAMGTHSLSLIVMAAYAMSYLCLSATNRGPRNAIQQSTLAPGIE